MKTMKKIITLIGATLLLTALSTSSSFAGKPAGGGGGKVAVESANPGSAIQGEEKDIYISGSGFGPGANVRYLVTGTDDDTQIEVLSTEYIDATGELKTRVKVKDAAAIIDYDIEVQAASGRKGKGTTLFKVSASEDNCETSVEKAPAIAYLTETEKTGPRKDYVYTRDLMLASADGCITTLLLEHAAQWLPDTKKNESKNRFIENVDGVRLVTSGNHGIVSWYDVYEDPWMLEYIEFDFDSEGNVFTTPDDKGSYVSSIGYLIVEQDIRILDNGDLLAALIEKEDNGAPRRVLVVNLTTGEEQILSSGLCHYEAPDGNCFNTRYGSLIWDPAGHMFYVDLTNVSDYSDYQNYLVRYEFDQLGGWFGPQPIMTTVGANPVQKDLKIDGVSLDGLISYTFLEELPVNGSQKFGGILNPETCLPTLCDGLDGIVAWDGHLGKWTSDNTILSFDNRNIVEYLDPLFSTESRILIRGVDTSFDTDL